jgi:alpha-galactosidase
MEKLCKAICVVLLGISLCLFSSCGDIVSEKEELPAQKYKESNDGLALTPPMGWNSWYSFRIDDVNETVIKQMADAMVQSGMKDAGYEYINIDAGWFFERDANGNMKADEKKFPGGMKSLADYIHSKGLKAGIYTDVGEKGCGQAGSKKEYYQRDTRRFAEWGYDLLKVDCCGGDWSEGGFRRQYKEFAQALAKCGRPIVFSICSQGEDAPWNWAYKIGNYYRVGHDIDFSHWGKNEEDVKKWHSDEWNGVIYEIDTASPHIEKNRPGHWADLDMLLIGGAKYEGFRDANNIPKRRLNETEMKSQLSMWCMFSSPLMAGNDLRNMSKETAGIFCNKEAIAINQDRLGRAASMVDEQGEGLQVWSKVLESEKSGRRAVALFNRTDKEAEISLYVKKTGLQEKFKVRNLWEHKDMGTYSKSYTALVPSHGVELLLVEGKECGPVERKWVKVDDRDGKLSWRGQWTKIDNEKENYQGTATSTVEKGASVECSFEGEAVRLLVKSTPEYGRADIYIDGKFHKTVDMTGGYGRYSTVRQYPIYVNTTLEPGNHTIKVVNTDGKRIVVDGIEYLVRTTRCKEKES